MTGTMEAFEAAKRGIILPGRGPRHGYYDVRQGDCWRVVDRDVIDVRELANGGTARWTTVHHVKAGMLELYPSEYTWPLADLSNHLVKHRAERGQLYSAGRFTVWYFPRVRRARVMLRYFERGYPDVDRVRRILPLVRWQHELVVRRRYQVQTDPDDRNALMVLFDHLMETGGRTDG